MKQLVEYWEMKVQRFYQQQHPQVISVIFSVLDENNSLDRVNENQILLSDSLKLLLEYYYDLQILHIKPSSTLTMLRESIWIISVLPLISFSGSCSAHSSQWIKLLEFCQLPPSTSAVTCCSVSSVSTLQTKPFCSWSEYQSIMNYGKSFLKRCESAKSRSPNLSVLKVVLTKLLIFQDVYSFLSRSVSSLSSLLVSSLEEKEKALSLFSAVHTFHQIVDISCESFYRLVCCLSRPSSLFMKQYEKEKEETKKEGFAQMVDLFDQKPEVAIDVYCWCRGADDGCEMICCDSCSEWFHRRCITSSTGKPSVHKKRKNNLAVLHTKITPSSDYAKKYNSKKRKTQELFSPLAVVEESVVVAEPKVGLVNATSSDLSVFVDVAAANPVNPECLLPSISASFTDVPLTAEENNNYYCLSCKLLLI
jgi:hypothetical protein